MNMTGLAWLAAGLGAASIALTVAIGIGALYQGTRLVNLGQGALVMVPSILLSICASALALFQLHRKVWIPVVVAAISWLTLLAAFGVAGFQSLF